MDCKLDSKALRSLRKIVGKDEVAYNSYLSEAVANDGNPTKGFSEWYAKRHDGKLPNFDNPNSIAMAREVIAYYYHERPDGEMTVENEAYNNSRVINGYTDANAQDFAVRTIVNQILDLYNNDVTNNNIVTENKRSYYVGKVKARIAGLLSSRVAKLEEIDIREAQKRIKEGGFNYLDKVFEKQSATNQDVNVYALFKEVYNNAREQASGRTYSQLFFDRVFRNSKLGDIRFDEDPTQEVEERDIEEAFNDELLEDGTQSETDSDESKDRTIQDLDNHDGLFVDFKKHIDTKLKLYLSTIPRLNSTKQTKGKWDYNFGNPLGVADTMDSEELYSILYDSDSINYTNAETMLQSLRQVAENIPGMAGIAKLVNDLDNNYDLLNEFYKTFSKRVMRKQILSLEDGIVNTSSRNRTSSKILSLQFEYQNSLKTTIINADQDFARRQLNKLKGELLGLYEEKNGKVKAVSSKEEKKFLNDFCDFVNIFFPTIDKQSIAYYIRNEQREDGAVDARNNFNRLFSIFDDIVNNIDASKSSYSNKITNIVEGRRINNLLDRSKSPNAEGRQAIWDKYSKGRYPTKEDYVDLTPVYASEYVNATASKAAVQLGTILSKYATVKTELNSYNVKHNRSSDIINDSFITNLLNTLENPEALANYGKLKFRSHQYDFSNILIEKRDEQGNIINRGLFRRIDGQLVPTEYASYLLNVTLFNGATDYGSKQAATYSEMSEADYITTAFLDFFHCDTEHRELGVDFANYFMRTPSDAPKNFIVTAPRYSTKDLFKVSNPEVITNLVNNIINNIPVISRNDYLDRYASLSPREITRAEAVRYLTANKLGNINIRPSEVNEFQSKQGDTITTTFKYTTETGTNTIVLQGTRGAQNGSAITLENPTLLGVIADEDYNTLVLDETLTTGIENYARTQSIRNGELQFEVDVNHPIFKQYKAMFMQELTDMNSALTLIFDRNSDGSLANYSPTYNKRFQEKEGRNALYKVYHYNGDVIQDGKLTGRVFESDRFALENSNYLNELFSSDTEGGGVFNLLYGGRDSSNESFIHRDDSGNVVLTDAQEAAVNDAISKYIVEFTAEQRSRIEDSRRFIENTEELTEDKINEFAINYNLAYMSFNDIFEGDSKFYKNAQDELKRAKESQGSGVPYGIRDTTRLFDNKDTNKQIVNRSPLTGRKFIKKHYVDGQLVEEEVEIPQYDRFTGVTIVNTIRTVEGAEQNGDLANKLAKIYEKESNLKHQAALNLANAFLAGYENTKVNDAQSYITFEEWVRRITARGQFSQYESLINAILDETKPVDAKTIKQFIQIQKNFYYDLTYNEDLGLTAPRQIKNAEFVLVPRFIRGTQLEQVYNLMNKYGIDQLNTEETSKAGKADVLQIWDDKGDINPAIIEDANSDITAQPVSEFGKAVNRAKEAYNYNFLYTQQETPQHVDSMNKAAIQIMKKVLDNVDESNPKLKAAKDEFFKLYCANIKDSFDSLAQELNLKFKSNGEVESLDYAHLFDMLMDEAKRQNVDSNLLDFFTYDETSLDGLPETLMPLYVSSISTKAENIVQALFNNRITRQKLPGFHAAQVTNVGWKSLGEQVEGVTYNKELHYHPNGEPYVEVMLPKSNFGFQLTKKDGTLKTDEELLKELQEGGLDTFIGYRIPTEGKQSIAVMKVVGFTDDALGSTIVVPDAWVAQTGSDFDIDSIYGINFATSISPDGEIVKVPYQTVAGTSYNNYVKSNMPAEDAALTENKEFNYNNYAIEHNLLSRDEWSKQNPNVVISDNTRNARNNQILQDMLTILEDDSSLEENLSRSNFDDLVAARNKISPTAMARRAKRSPYNFFDQAAYMYDAMSGAKLKAFSVSRDTFASICNTVRPTLKTQQAITVAYDLTQYDEVQLRKSFTHGDNIRKVGNTLYVNHRMFGWSNDNKNAVGKLITPYTSQTTAHILDAIKEGAIPNENDYTFGVFKLFPDMGMDYDTAVSFIMQPAVTRIVNAYNNNKSIYTIGNNNPIYEAIKGIARDLGISVPANAKIGNVIDAINADTEVMDAFHKWFGNIGAIELTDNFIQRIAVDPKRQMGRIRQYDELGTTTPVEESNNKTLARQLLAYDLGIALQYYKFNNLASKLRKIQVLCNPDKFGAKQSIFATSKVFDDAQNLITEEKNGKNSIPFVVDINGTETNFLEAIYPGIDKGLDSFVTSNDTNSKYPTLYYFLKYASGTSVKVNKNLFLTQSDQFNGIIKRITGCFTNGKKQLTEQVYKDYKNYLLNYLYTMPTDGDTISRPITYLNGKFGAAYYDNPRVEELEDEKERLFGYSRSAENYVPDKDGKLVEFEVADINNPTEDEVRQFLYLSPAQKINWVKSHFSNPLIAKYLSTNMFNTLPNRRGMQTIRFVEDNESIETVYEQFEKTFHNSNPFLKATAIDIVKYAFVVEGYKMRRNAVSKVIRNTVLYNSLNKDGSIVNGMGVIDKLNNIFSHLSDYFTEDVLLSTQENFIRQSEDLRAIQGFTVQRQNKRYDLNRLEQDIIRLNVRHDGDLITRYGIGYEIGKDKKQIATNNYVRLRFNKRDGFVLYRIRQVGDNIFLYPLNNLSPNENGTFSANTTNNKYPNKQYYERLITDFTGEDNAVLDSNWLTNYNGRISEEGRGVETYRSNRQVVTSTSAREFDINNPAPNEVGAFDFIKQRVNTLKDYLYKGTPIYIESNALAKYITNVGAENGSVQTIMIDGTPYQVRIRKAPRKGYENYLKLNNANKSINIKNGSRQQVLTNLQDRVKREGRDLNNANIFIIESFESINATPTGEVMNSSIREAVNVGAQSFKTFAYNGNADAQHALDKLEDVTQTKNGDIKERDFAPAMRITAEFIDKATDSILDDLKNFARDPVTDEMLSVNDPKAIDLIRNNEAERNRFLKLILTAKAIIEDYSIYNGIDSKDEEMHKYIQRIKNKLNVLNSNEMIDEAYHNFGNLYLAKLSSDPRIQRDLITIFDGYNSTSFLDAMINDLQESGNPMVQIITNKMMTDIESKEAQMRKQVRRFQAFKADVERRAKAAGKSIDMNKVVDQHGFRHTAYSEEFKKDLQELRDACDEARKNYGVWSTQYSLARHKYDAFKLKYTNQPFIDDYYREKLAIEEAMLQDGIGARSTFDDKGLFDDPNVKKETDPRYIGFRYILQEYNRLRNEQRELRSHIDSNGNLDEAYQERLKQVEDEIERLTAPMYKDENGEYSPRVYYDPMTNPMPDRTKDEKAFRHALLYGGASAQALRNYISAMRELNHKYFRYDAEFGFEEDLRRNLDVIERYESEYRDSSGRLTVPMAQLLSHEDYANARQWLAHNAHYVHSQKYWDEVTRLTRTINDNKNGNKARMRTNQLARELDAYDYKHTVDARKFSDEQIASIKAEEERFYQHHQNNSYSDRNLISNGTPDNNIYTTEFYTGMTTDGASNQDWLNLTREINDILQEVYYVRERLVRTDELDIDTLKKLSNLYNRLAATKRKEGATNGKEVAKFIADNVDFNIDQDKFDTLNAWAKQKAVELGKPWYNAWYAANTEVVYDENGNIELNDDGTAVVRPNHFLYGYVSPKEAVKDKFIDKKKTETLGKLHEMSVRSNTEYYYEKYREMKAKGEEAFNTWYKANHVYNPYTGAMQPLTCWTTTEPNPNWIKANGAEGRWEPTYINTERTPRAGEIDEDTGIIHPDTVNKNYHEGSTASNYKVGTGYDNIVQLNEFEEEVNRKFGEIIEALTHTDASRRFAREGRMPLAHKPGEVKWTDYGKELTKFVGYAEGTEGYDEFYTDANISFARDRTNPMPMTSLLHAKNGVRLEVKRPKEPVLADYDNAEDYDKAYKEYNERLEQYNAAKEQYDKELQAESESVMDRNWWRVMEEFMIRSAHYNAVQDNKYLFYYGEQMLRKHKVYQTNIGSSNYIRDEYTSTDETTQYVTHEDSNLHKQYINWGRRVLYNQFRERNRVVTTIGNVLQNWTSSTFMMLNITGGIANIIQGETQIGGEWFAREYFGAKAWAKGKQRWGSGITSYLRNLYKPTSTTLVEAIIKEYNIVDYDELNGVPREKSRLEYLERIRNITYFPQAIGEHMMQNSAMLAMMESHRLVINPDADEKGQPKYKAVNFEEYVRDIGDSIMTNMMTEEQVAKFNEMKRNIKEDPNQLKYYALLRRNLASEFMTRYFTKEQKKEYRQKFKEARKKAREEFNDDTKHPTMFSQYKLGDDGYLDFADNSILAGLQEEEAYTIAAKFKQRVLSVNKKIHGNYGKLDAAYLERYWWGRLVMQYHKHIYPGIMKHFRRQGYYNESRGTNEKGMYTSLYDFLSLNIRAMKDINNMTDAQVGAMEGVQNIFKTAFDIALNLRDNWGIIPQSERANMLRLLAEWTGAIGAVCMAIAVKCIMEDDDDLEDSILLNLALYEADRATSESLQFIPPFTFAEAKKLWSNPVAVQSQIADVFNILNSASQMILQGDDYNPNYETGRFAGQNRIGVYLKRRIPLWRPIDNLIHIADNNRYYKLGDNLLSIIPTEPIVDWVTE